MRKPTVELDKAGYLPLSEELRPRDFRFRESVRPDPSYFGELTDFAYAYVKNHYSEGTRSILSARDLRWAALYIGYSLEHSEALLLLEEIETRVREEQMPIESGPSEY